MKKLALITAALFTGMFIQAQINTVSTNSSTFDSKPVNTNCQTTYRITNDFNLFESKTATPTYYSGYRITNNFDPLDSQTITPLYNKCQGNSDLNLFNNNTIKK